MRALPALLAAVALIAPRSAAAFCRTTTNVAFQPTEERPCDTEGKPLFWPTRCVGVAQHKSDSEQVNASTAERVLGVAVSAWASVTCDACGAAGKPSLILQSLGPTTCGFGYARDGANANIVIYRDSGWSHEPDMLALTTVSFRKDTGEIVDADVEINTEQHKIAVDKVQPDAYDLESILTHELGHVLGLAHSFDAAATMRARYDMGDTSMRDLARDDSCGLCAAAPPNRDAPCSPGSATCGAPTPNNETTAPGPGYSCDCSTPGVAAPGSALASLALLLLLRRRRRAAS